MPTTRTERAKTARYYRKREQVVDVAVELFSKNGYASTGVADIGTAAGLPAVRCTTTSVPKKSCWPRSTTA